MLAGGAALENTASLALPAPEAEVEGWRGVGAFRSARVPVRHRASSWPLGSRGPGLQIRWRPTSVKGCSPGVCLWCGPEGKKNL